MHFLPTRDLTSLFDTRAIRTRARRLLGVLGVTLAICVLAASRAGASGFPGIRFGYEHGSVVAANPTAICYNPGALGFSGTQLFLDVSLGMRDFSWKHAPAPTDTPAPAGFEGANAGTASALTFGAGPQFGASIELGKLTLGGGWYAPYGGTTLQFDRNEVYAASMYPRAADGVSRWHGYRASAIYIFSTVGAALRFGPLSFGAVGNVIISRYEVHRAQNAPLVGTDITRELRVKVETDGLHASFAVGAMLEAIPEQLWFGASYQAQPSLGEMLLDGTYTVVDNGDQSRTQNITMHQGLPDIVRAGARFRPVPEFELRLTGDLTRWSLNGTQCVAVRGMRCAVRRDGSAATGSGVIKNLPRYWQDTIAVRVGFSYWLVPSFELFGGGGFEPAAVPDATLDPLTADADNLLLSLGGRWEVSETWYVGLSYNHNQSFTRDTTGRSQLTVPSTVSQSVDGGGEYRQWFGVVNFNFAKTF